MRKPEDALTWLNLAMICVVYLAVIEPKMFINEGTVPGMSIIALGAMIMAMAVGVRDLYEKLTE